MLTKEQLDNLYKLARTKPVVAAAMASYSRANSGVSETEMLYGLVVALQSQVDTLEEALLKQTKTQVPQFLLKGVDPGLLQGSSPVPYEVPRCSCCGATRDEGVRLQNGPYRCSNCL